MFARPPVSEWQLVKWVEVNRNLTFGTNDKEGLFGAAVDMFLLSETRHIIHAVQSGFSNMAALVGGQNTTRLGEYQGRRDAMPMDL